VLVLFIMLFHLRFFKSMLGEKPRFWHGVILALLFGLVAIYGTYSGVQTAGAIANIRNMGPMMAGLIAGPWVGLGAGVIGGIQRYFMGGFTALPCAVGTMLSGVLAGSLFLAFKGKVGIWKPTVFAFLMETADMALLLLAARPFNDALHLVSIIAMPMILADTFGIAVFAFLLRDICSGDDKPAQCAKPLD
jgi:sigma-B regulation protein RsbU (phosphoserine phosphatase)